MERYDSIGGIKGEVYIAETKGSKGVHGKYYWGDVLDVLETLVPEYEGKVQLIYMDPPFFTGQEFKYKQPIGSKGWKGDRDYIVSHTAYVDRHNREDFFIMIEKVFSYAHKLLSDEGCLYVHIDYRTSAHMKIILDDIFGPDNFLNEIIWHYRSGGRAKRHFSRKHDNILFYRKSKAYYFDIEAVGRPRGMEKKNNMKKNIDESGRIYWSIKSAGKEYRYYADDKIYPSDVWDDIPHLHQRNPERTGYDTQKPEALLERIVLASSRPGDLVADFFAGSGTTLDVAQQHGRNWLGIDSSIFSLHTCRRRLLHEKGPNHICFLYSKQISPTLWSRESRNSIAIADLTDDIEAVDHWGVGYISNGIYSNVRYSSRSSSFPDLDAEFTLDSLENGTIHNGELCVHTVDIYGDQKFYIKQKRR